MRVTSIQLEIKDQPKEEAVQSTLKLLDDIPESDLVLLPELWPSGYLSFDRYQKESEPMDGPTVKAFQEKAATLKSYLLMGSVVEREEYNLFNTAVLINPEGQIAATYRKIHLFGYQSEERRLLKPGNKLGLGETSWGTIGMTTCYDLRFPELYRKMVDRGALFFFIPSAWPLSRLDAWRLFNRARAHENLAYLVSCNCAGSNGGISYAGHSMIVDPLGKVIAEGGEDGCFVTAELDPDLVHETRKDFSALDDRIFRSIE